MLISCNRLKKYIKNSEDIDFKTIWDTFTMKTAEVEAVKEKGMDLKDVVTVQIVSCEKHPDSKKLSLLKVSDGTQEYEIVCGAPNVRVGLIGVLVKEGGMVGGISITARNLAGYVSHGMMCAMDELGIGEDHEGILELPSDTPLGVDFCDYYPVRDIIVEIDNKSLTNRPDLWGHYGIAREIAAITHHELLPLELYDVQNDLKDLDITVSEPSLCRRYCGIQVENLNHNTTPLEMQIFLNYTGMRSINLFVDLTNYLMLELGQPMHAFDARVVKNIDVRLAKDGDRYTTLDGVERTLTHETLMISNGEKYFGIAGVMGGLDSEILPDTNSIFLESANFHAGSIRKTAVSLGLRTEASARYEKSLDPNLCDISLRRLLFLLQKENPEMRISSNLTDLYKDVLKEKKISLKKETLKRYTAIDISEQQVQDILESLGFQVEVFEDAYEVTVPTYRATKDISNDADLIEEIVRMYGYDQMQELPLEVEATARVHEQVWDEEYQVKHYLATKWNLHEVHSYLWYETDLLNKLGIIKDGIRLLAPYKNNLLRDDLSLSLLPMIRNNLKNQNQAFVFELGTIFENNKNKRVLSILLAQDETLVSETYYRAKKIVSSLFKSLKHDTVVYKSGQAEEYYETSKVLDVYVGSTFMGQMKLFGSNAMRYVGKKKCVVAVDIDFDQYVAYKKQPILFEEISKYPVVTLDYTILTNKEMKYCDLNKILTQFHHEMIQNCSFIDCYEDAQNKKYTIRYIVGNKTRTLESEELEVFKNQFISYIKEKGLEIIF